ncbi:GTPase HflX [Endozoicomonas montiporae]|uniref:GTPase HflX n=2 Tax=Endozoicomonas montiporae TaxID=1027273 RepID=A0A081MZE5_9GAMM|nr:ribosome rescue GTPase HflX [Endozoicomonas montiporae]AMO54749.1 GTP-binding protein HflX [Endozoicomonas montiporae CL-33]KEQ11568.1 GTPase HflX [Endozoicomonas montiporae]
MFFERHEGGENAILVHLDMTDDKEREDPHEFRELARSAGISEIDFVTVSSNKPSPRYFIGQGKVEEIQQLVKLHEADVVLFNHALSPSQERNLEKEFECKVVDRTGLILDIFAQRARTFEGKLQVELAQLQHLSTRLVRGWTHLERQKGGIGLRGPGETQLETDRRLLRVRIKSITKRLDKVRKQRDQGRRYRKRAEVPLVSLVGYTNAGKSTLFNALTESDVYAQDQLFATLDPTLRRLDLPDVGESVLADTVGFIRHLPHKLVEAFRATLEETAQADLLLHVIDAHDPERLDNIKQVHDVLEEIKADEVPRLQVYNKIDLLENVEPKIQRDDQGKPVRVWVSAMQGEGLELVLQAVAELLGEDLVQGTLRLEPAQGKVRSRLYQLGAIQSEEYAETGELLLDIRLPRHDFDRISKQEGLQKSCLVER